MKNRNRKHFHWRRIVKQMLLGLDWNGWLEAHARANGLELIYKTNGYIAQNDEFLFNTTEVKIIS